jgi:hypothetical protein
MAQEDNFELVEVDNMSIRILRSTPLYSQTAVVLSVMFGEKNTDKPSFSFEKMKNIMALNAFVSFGMAIMITAMLTSGDAFQRPYNKLPTKFGHISKLKGGVHRWSVNLNTA